MRVVSITKTDINKYQKTVHAEKNDKKTFKGSVNGNFYTDEVIKEAKEAFKNPNWRKKFMQAKKTVSESFSNWHEREGNDLTGRILMGIFTLGVSEITWGLAHTAMDAMDNKSIDRHVQEIERCIEDLKKSNGKVE